MKILLITIAVISILVALFVVVVRPWLRDKPWAQGFMRAIEPFEIFGYGKSESLLWGRFLTGLGALLTALIQIGSIDLSPIKPLLPDGWQWIPDVAPLAVSVLGIIQELNRRDTTKPLAVVAMPIDAPPEVKAVVAEAAAVNKEAAAVVTQAAKAA